MKKSISQGFILDNDNLAALKYPDKSIYHSNDCKECPLGCYRFLYWKVQSSIFLTAYPGGAYPSCHNLYENIFVLFFLPIQHSFSCQPYPGAMSVNGFLSLSISLVMYW